MAASPITPWQTEEEKLEAVTDFTFLLSKITVDSDWSQMLLLGRKAMTNLDSVLKSRDITDSMDMNLRNLQEIVEDRGAWHATVQGVENSRTQLSDWATISHLNNVSSRWWQYKRTAEMPALGNIHQQFLSSIQYGENKGFVFLT